MNVGQLKSLGLTVVSMAAFSSLSALCSLSLLVTSNPPAAMRRPRWRLTSAVRRPLAFYFEIEV
jgi:hypothetical protein